jgi:hypothetical protein
LLFAVGFARLGMLGLARQCAFCFIISIFLFASMLGETHGFFIEGSSGFGRRIIISFISIITFFLNFIIVVFHQIALIFQFARSFFIFLN